MRIPGHPEAERVINASRLCCDTHHLTYGATPRSRLEVEKTIRAVRAAIATNPTGEDVQRLRAELGGGGDTA